MLVSAWLTAAVCLRQVENTDDDDCHSNKSLDLNFGRKLIDFKLSTSSSSSAPPEEQTPSSTSAPQEPLESSEEKPSSSCSPTAYKHVCQICRKSFRYATTLARHERAHLSEEAPPPAEEEEEAKESRAAEEEQEEFETTEVEEAKGAESEGGERGESEEEKEERSDEEASEPKSVEGGGGGGRVDKRKKICNECGKRFWSLQDLTRHLRSHTGTSHTVLLVWPRR